MMKWMSLFAASCLLAACADGYPTADANLTSPLDMSQQERIAAMNEMGAKRRDGQRWHYALAPGCVLEVMAAGGPPSPKGRWKLVNGMDAEMGHDGDAGHYTVRLTQAGRPVGQVFATPSWADAVGMRLLVKTVQVECARPATAPPPG